MLESFSEPLRVCLFGASGGIGAALTQTLADDPAVDSIYAGARDVDAIARHEKVRPFAFDLLDEGSIAAAAHSTGDRGIFNLIIIATGLLHDGEALQPERGSKMQSAEAYSRAFAINATGPALIGKHFLPLLAAQGRTIFAALSARVGSIEDNRLGGWHAYRASKAALNMIMRNFSIEMAARNKAAIAVALHPGTVDTALSQPFQRGVAAGKLFTPEFAADRLLRVIDSLSAQDSGRLFAWDGKHIPF